MKKFFFINILIVMLLIIGALLLGKLSILIYLNIITLLLIILFPFLLLLTNFRMRDMVASCKIAMKNTACTKKDLRFAYIFFRTMQKYIIVTTIIVVAIGFVILTNLDLKATKILTLSRGIGLIAKSVVYASLMILLVNIPFISSIQKKRVMKK